MNYSFKSLFLIINNYYSLLKYYFGTEIYEFSFYMEIYESHKNKIRITNLALKCFSTKIPQIHITRISSIVKFLKRSPFILNIKIKINF